MKNFAVLFMVLILFSGLNSCPQEQGAELRILEINADTSETLVEYGSLVPAEIFIRNLSLTDTFQGEIKVTLSREIPYDEEFFCGGLESQSSFTLVGLEPGEMIVYEGLSFTLCRPGDYFLKAVLESFPSDQSKGNTHKKEAMEMLQWQEVTDLSFMDPSPDFPMVGCRVEDDPPPDGIFLLCAFYLWNVGNTPVNLAALGPEMAAVLTRPGGEIEEPFFYDSSSFLPPHNVVETMFSWLVQDSGAHHIEFLVDPRNLLQEASEENNRYLMMFSVE